MKYSAERIVTKFQQLVGRQPTQEEISTINNKDKTLTSAICEMFKIEQPNMMYTAGAHCKSCNGD